MEAQMTNKQHWYCVDGRQGTEWVPADLVGTEPIADETLRTALRDYCENDLIDAEITRVFGYGVRSSMPGYMDCTPWTVYTNLREARKAYSAERRANRGED